MVQCLLQEVMVEIEQPASKLTYADYLLFPDDGLRHEIIDGEHFVTPSPVIRHQRISKRLLMAIDLFLQQRPLGEVFSAPCDVVLSDTDIVVPDLIYVSRERAHVVTEKNLRGAPALAIEVLSPGTRSRDERLKKDLYERAGVEEYWLVDPEASVVTVYRRGAGGFDEPRRYEKSSTDRLTSPLFPGLELPLDEILA